MVFRHLTVLYHWKHQQKGNFLIHHHAHTEHFKANHLKVPGLEIQLKIYTGFVFPDQTVAMFLLRIVKN